MPDQSSLDPILISAKDAARRLGVAPWTVYQLLREEKLESRWIRNRRLIAVTDLEEYAANLPRRRPTSEEAS